MKKLFHNCVVMLTLLFLPTAAVQAQVPAWAFSGNPLSGSSANLNPGLAMSPDGQTLVTGNFAGVTFTNNFPLYHSQLFVSTNSGASWLDESPYDRYLLAIAAANNGTIYTAGFFGGPAQYEAVIVCSADGTKVAEMGQNNEADEYFPPWQLNVSTNSLMSISSPLLPNNSGNYDFWNGVTMTPDGSRLFCWNGSTYYSIAETNWMATQGIFGGPQYWTQMNVPVPGPLLSSSDGSILISGGSYLSADSGVTWTNINPPGLIETLSWNGSTMAAVNGGSIYTTTNGGASWILNITPNTVTGWSSLVASSNGAEMAAIGNDNAIYFASGTSGSPIFQGASVSGTGMSFSWGAIAGQTYQVQYNTGLNPGSWSNLGSSMVATNGVMSTVDPVAAPQRFYRVLFMQ